jgi:hypothetical protein
MIIICIYIYIETLQRKSRAKYVVWHVEGSLTFFRVVGTRLVGGYYFLQIFMGNRYWHVALNLDSLFIVFGNGFYSCSKITKFLYFVFVPENLSFHWIVSVYIHCTRYQHTKDGEFIILDCAQLLNRAISNDSWDLLLSQSV